MAARFSGSEHGSRFHRRQPLHWSFRYEGRFVDFGPFARTRRGLRYVSRSVRSCGMRLFRLVISTFVAVFFYCGCVLLHSLDRVPGTSGNAAAAPAPGPKAGRIAGLSCRFVLPFLANQRQNCYDRRTIKYSLGVDPTVVSPGAISITATPSKRQTNSDEASITRPR